MHEATVQLGGVQLHVSKTIMCKKSIEPSVQLPIVDNPNQPNRSSNSTGRVHDSNFCLHHMA